jgi:predicted DCC family thiol-disulfide oxidoreductase YuxK
MAQTLKIRQVVVYDDTCGFCRSFRKAAEKRDNQNNLEFIPGNQVDPDDFSPYPMPRDISGSLAMFDKDGRLYRGAVAMGKIMIQLGGMWKLMGKILSWPVIRNVADYCYRAVARQRQRFSSKLKSG